MILVKKKDVIDAMENTDWYHVNSNGKLVSGANSDEDVALYKEADVYKAIDSVEPVDAIPIEFIENKIDEYREKEDQTKDEPLSGYFEWVRTSERRSLEWLLLDWKAEQEKHECQEEALMNQ